jgi:DNA-binding response OmpR family regulator
VPASILLVDDEPSILATLTPLLRSRGYQVHAVRTGQACLDALSRVTPDVVVLDLGLPDIDGVDVCRLVRAEHGVPILVLSARGGERDKVAALDAGADDYITKPFATSDAIARVQAVLGPPPGDGQQ